LNDDSSVGPAYGGGDPVSVPHHDALDDGLSACDIFCVGFMMMGHLPTVRTPLCNQDNDGTPPIKAEGA
jgi:hypothetical protein